MVISNSDKKVINFIEEFKIATTDTLCELFYSSLRYGQHRLSLLYKNKVLQRERDLYTKQYYYYIKKPKQLKHSLLLTNFYRELNKIAKVEFFKNEFIIEDIRADGFIAYEISGRKDIAFLEVEISNKGFDLAKYERLEKLNKLKRYNFPKFPTIIAVTNKNIPKSHLEIIRIDEEMQNINKILCKT